ncbi:sigma-70 family RNA polymerase sigma factor [Microbulbifer sp. OS29]|uniref:Sigma-70 family RNA polymerase sigma factor n=1 Tax=Microbulbifer okhotskensis TaxID=2926617 RepID=A0A9X2EMJ9_9GAMM|nr:sigma-70 family RNA polymerase sigma factor [Microbulbifer okhotskensis]MCO1335032.1 sigma-70 family RNA polymerase sigma factor [Microbulbifer okhotskensis]
MELRDQLFQQAIAEHTQGVSRVARSYVRSTAEQEDLLLEIWLGLWRALPAFLGDASLKTFVYRIAHNRCVTEIARRKPQHAGEEELMEVVDSHPGPDECLAAERKSESLVNAVQRLPLGLRQTLTLRLEGLSYAEISEVLGISESNIAVRLNRAKERLNIYLSGGEK